MVIAGLRAGACRAIEDPGSQLPTGLGQQEERSEGVVGLGLPVPDLQETGDP